MSSSNGGHCWCAPGGMMMANRRSVGRSAIGSIVTYDDWGDGPQCTMCGRIKEADHVD